MIRKIGERLTLVGVAHVIPESRDEVIKNIREREPEVVGVELCPSRYFELLDKPRTKRNLKMSFSREGILAMILSFFQEKIGQQTGMLPGEEMVAAVKEAQNAGAEVKLIDRNINLTLQRLIEKLSFFEKIKLLMETLASIFWPEMEIDVESITEDEVVEELLSSLRDYSMSAYQVLIEERDEYMADQIVRLLRSRSGEVLCVVGAGHVPGLTERIESVLENGDPEPWETLELNW